MGNRNTVGYQTIDVSTTAMTLTVPVAAKGCIITVESTDAVRFRGDGTAPTSSEGHYLAASAVLTLMSRNYKQYMENLKIIRVTADTKIKISYFDGVNMGNVNQVGYQTLNVQDSAVGLTVPAAAKKALITVEATNAVRFRADGTDPTTSEGNYLAGGSTFTITDGNYEQFLAAVKWIKAVNNGIIKVTYFD